MPTSWDAQSAVRQGVTTAIGGEGGTPVPAGQIAGYFKRLETQGISLNFGTYFSETQTRVPVLGMSARAPNAAELERKVYPVPDEIDREIARLKLETMGIEIDTLTEEQERYLASWDEGT